MGRPTDVQTNREKDFPTERHTDRQIDRQTNKRKRQADTHR